MKIYVVNEEDTLQSIAERFQVSIERLAFDNEIQREELVVGQALLILEPEQIYTIEEGDTLAGIAEKFERTVIRLVRNNPYLLNNIIKRSWIKYTPNIISETSFKHNLVFSENFILFTFLTKNTKIATAVIAILGYK